MHTNYINGLELLFTSRILACRVVAVGICGLGVLNGFA